MIAWEEVLKYPQGGGKAKAEAKPSERETVRDGTNRHVWFFRFPWDLWRGAVGTWEWKD